MTIRVRLILLVLIVLLPALGAASWVVFRTWQAGHAALDRQADEGTRALITGIDQEFTKYQAIARALAASPLLDRAPRLTERERALFDQNVRRAIQGSPVTVELLSESVRWIDTRLPSSAPPRPLERGESRLAGRPGIRVLNGAEHEGGGVAFVEPVFERGRALAMNLLVVMPMAELHRLMGPRPLNGTWGTLLLDPSGQVVVRHAPDSGGMRGAAALDALIRESLAGRSEGRFALRPPGGEPQRVYFSRGPRGWTTLTTVPRAQLDMAFSSAPARWLLGAVALLALAVAGAVGVARGELRRQLAEAVERTRQAEQWAASRERVEALGRLTGRVVHEFNNLLGVISNSAYLIQRQATQPALAMPVAATLRAVEAASRLTQQLLRFGGRQQCRPRHLALHDWLPGRREMLEVVLGRRIVLRIDTPDDGLCVRADPDELELALINLALNARDALPQAGTVHLRAERADGDSAAGLPDGRYLSITLSDNGPGIDPAQAQRVFEPFFTTKRDEPNAGFGLSQVHGLCAQAGGKAVLRSRPGQGTAVSLVLPAVDPEAPQAQRVEGANDPAPFVARVLLAEDNDSLGDVTVALIESMGARVERASHAAQALERLERGPAVDVLLTDVSMPGDLDGLDLARAVRQRWPQVRVVLISALGDRLKGVDNFRVLRKPCAPAVLIAALRQEAQST